LQIITIFQENLVLGHLSELISNRTEKFESAYTLLEYKL